MFIGQLCFTFWFFGQEAYGILVPWPRSNPHPLHWKAKSLSACFWKVLWAQGDESCKMGNTLRQREFIPNHSSFLFPPSYGSSEPCPLSPPSFFGSRRKRTAALWVWPLSPPCSSSLSVRLWVNGALPATCLWLTGSPSMEGQPGRVKVDQWVGG